MLKGTVVEKNEEYPCMRKAGDGQVVLFTKEGVGICIVKGAGGADVGCYNMYWDMQCFPHRFIGPVTLEEI